MQTTTVGRLLVNQALPPDLRDPELVLDKKTTLRLMRELAQRHPDKYREVSKQLADIGRHAGTEVGAYNFGLDDLRPTPTGRKLLEALRRRVYRIIDDDRLSDEQKAARIVLETGKVQKTLLDTVLDEALQSGNSLAKQVVSGARGNKVSLNSLLNGDLLYVDHHDRVIPLPVMRSYAQGLSFMDYWAGSYGARRGTVAKRLATQESGFLAKQLNQIAHRLMVVDQDDNETPEADRPLRGLPADVDDPDNEGALLAQEAGGYPRNTPLTPKILADLKAKGIQRILVRSPLVSHAPGDGVYARDVGIREHGRLAGRGEQVGMVAAQALSEPLTQGQLSARHSGGVAGQEKAVSVLGTVTALVQVPQQFVGVAAHSLRDGRVDRIEKAAAGGHYVFIDGHSHYVPPHRQIKVKVGDIVEAGDVLTDGIPHPALIVEHKGVGEGRRYFAEALRQLFKDSNLPVHRRNVELLARGLINHVRLNEEWEGRVPDDVVPYSTVERLYRPRPDAQKLPVERAVGKYLERPVLHYTIGTPVRPSVLRTLQQFHIKTVDVHDKPPPFKAEMIRGMESLQHDPDWITRMYGSGLKRSLLDAVHYGSTSDETGTSFVPGLARAVDFGRVGLVRVPEPGVPPPVDPEQAWRKAQGQHVKAAEGFWSRWFSGNKTNQSTSTNPSKPAKGTAAASATTPPPSAAPSPIFPSPPARIPVQASPQRMDPNLWRNPAIYQAVAGHPSGYQYGPGGFYGAVTRLGTFLNAQDMATLTRGPQPAAGGTAATPSPYAFSFTPAASAHPDGVGMAGGANAAASGGGAAGGANAAASGGWTTGDKGGGPAVIKQYATGTFLGDMGIHAVLSAAGTGIRSLLGFKPPGGLLGSLGATLKGVPLISTGFNTANVVGDLLLDKNWQWRNWSGIWERSQQRAAEHAETTFRAALDPSRFLTHPLTTLDDLSGLVFEPADNINLIVQLAALAGQSLYDAGSQMFSGWNEAYSQGRRAMEAWLSQTGKGTAGFIANPIHNPTPWANVPVIGKVFDLSWQQGVGEALDRHAAQTSAPSRLRFWEGMLQRWQEAGMPSQWTDPETGAPFDLNRVFAEMEAARRQSGGS